MINLPLLAVLSVPGSKLTDADNGGVGGVDWPSCSATTSKDAKLSLIYTESGMPTNNFW